MDEQCIEESCATAYLALQLVVAGVALVLVDALLDMGFVALEVDVLDALLAVGGFVLLGEGHGAVDADSHSHGGEAEGVGLAGLLLPALLLLGTLQDALFTLLGVHSLLQVALQAGFLLGGLPLYVYVVLFQVLDLLA